jgi:hypothetical protein
MTAGPDAQLRYWDWAAGKLAGAPATTPAEIVSIALVPGTPFAITAGSPHNNQDGNIDVWDLASGKRMLPANLLGKREYTWAVVLSADGKRALANGNHGVTAVDLSDLIELDARSTHELVRLAELAAGRRVFDGDLTGMTVEEWLARWRAGPAR